MKVRRLSTRSALLEVGILFLPSIPAYLWIWPNLNGFQVDVFQVIVYLYFLVGTLFIGLRRWDWNRLGLNRRGIFLALACGLVLLVARLSIILSIQWDLQPIHLTALRVLGDLLFYFGLVGFVEELLFRGLIYRILEDWGDTSRTHVNLAIWGSSIAFLLWHIFGQGVLVGFATLLIGLLFALIRRRAGGITGLIVLHALWDLETVWLVSSSNTGILDPGNIHIANPTISGLGFVMLLLVPAYLLWIHPRLQRSRLAGSREAEVKGK